MVVIPPTARPSGPMRFLGVTETCDLGALYLRLQAEGHEVRIARVGAAGERHPRRPRPARRRLAGGARLDPRPPGATGVILFEACRKGFGALQDELRRDGFNVIGGSAFGDRLENDRAFAQACSPSSAFRRAMSGNFRTARAADRLPRGKSRPLCAEVQRPGLRIRATIMSASSPDGSDVRAMLRGEAAAPRRGRRQFILMRHIEGVEMGVGAYFDGEKFLRPACLDWEHKRFFAGDMGELTGEMGTVATYDRSDTLLRANARPGRAACCARHGHVGYVNLNTIVNEDGIWPLEFTCRFGYPGFAILDPLQETVLGRAVRGDGRAAATTRFETLPGFCVGMVLTTPPFPYSRKQVDAAGRPAGLLRRRFDAADRRNVHFGEVGLRRAGSW